MKYGFFWGGVKNEWPFLGGGVIPVNYVAIWEVVEGQNIGYGNRSRHMPR